MAQQNRVCDILVPGTEYPIGSAEKITSENGTHLLVALHTTTHSMYCLFSPRLANTFTDQQIEQINNKTLSLIATYFGKTRSGDPIFQIRDADLPGPAFEEMAAAGAFDK